MPEQVAECIEEVGIGFLYAINHHPAMKYAIGPRREIGQRTIFNVLGPLTNPAGATHQLIGVYDPALTEPIARVLETLGSQAAYVVHGADGLDELSTTGINRVSHLHDGQVTTFMLDPADLGISKASLADMTGGSPAENAQITLDILSGKDKGPRRHIVLLNSAAVLSLNGSDLQTALDAAGEAIDSGAALNMLNQWIARSKSF
jgi:anthranilate phosphoribosyltransferase